MSSVGVSKCSILSEYIGPSLKSQRNGVILDQYYKAFACDTEEEQYNGTNLWSSVSAWDGDERRRMIGVKMNRGCIQLL